MRRIGSDVGVPELEPEVFDRAIVAVALTTGPEHRLVYINDAFRALFGPRELGEPAAEVFTEPRAARFVKMLDQVYADRAARQVNTPRTTEGTAPGAPGRRHFVYSCSPVVSRFGAGVLAVAIDTTSQVDAVEAAQLLSEQRQKALQRYEALMSAVTQIVWLMKPNGDITELVGGFQEFTGSPWRPVIDGEWLGAVHPHDRTRLVRTWTDASEGVPSLFVCTFRLRTASGEYRHVQSRAVPIERGGKLVEWIGATADIEDQWRNRLRERLLARVATVTAANDVPDAFAAVAAAVVPDLTDACAVFMLSSTGDGGAGGVGGPLTAVRVASTARPGLPDLPPLSHRPYIVGPIAQRVIESRRSKLLVFPSGEPPDGALSEMSRNWLRAARATSMTLVPIVIDSSVVAFACAAGCADSPPPGTADLALLGEILHEVREPLRQAVELQRTRHTALTLQRALLSATPRVPGAELAAHYQPASKTAEVGGDWYDALLLPDGTVTLTIGDIAGHDLDAATSMSQLRSMLRVIAYDQDHPNSPAESLSQLDRVADGLNIAPLVTVVHANLVPQPGGRWHVAWSNAGHPPPLLLPAEGEPRYLQGVGPDLPLCVAPAMPRSTWHHELKNGDTLLLYTDGLIEVPGTDLGEGMAALAEIAETARMEGLALAEMCARLLSGVGNRRDDAAVIGFRPITQGGGSRIPPWSGPILG
jgi:PAS domain S-box-containing protein